MPACTLGCAVWLCGAGFYFVFLCLKPTVGMPSPARPPFKVPELPLSTALACTGVLTSPHFMLCLIAKSTGEAINLDAFLFCICV